MKKIAIGLLFALTLAGCTAAPAANPNAGSGQPAASAPAESAQTDPTLQTIVDQAQSSISSLENAFSGTMSIKIEARGNALVYSYTYAEAVPDKDAAKAAIESSLGSQDAQFSTILDTLKKANVPSASIIIEYFDKDGSLIFSKEYK